MKKSTLLATRLKKSTLSTTTMLLVVFCLLSFQTINAQNEFITTWKTDNTGSSSNTEITIPAVGGSYNVDWNNDGTFDEFGLTGAVTHDFGTAGTYTIRMQGTFTIFFNNTGDKEKILDVIQWGTIAWTTFSAAFNGCENMDVTAIDTPNLTGVTNVSQMFFRCSALVGTSAFGNWDVSNVTNMEEMFSGATTFNQDLGNWDVQNVNNFKLMFSGATTFEGTNLDMWGNRFNASNISMQAMFRATALTGNITGWQTTNVISMAQMFSANNNFNQDIGNWDVSNVTTMSNMFIGASSFNQDLGDWSIQNVSRFDSMFAGAGAFEGTNLHLWNNRFNASNINMTSMFSFISSLTGDITGWQTANVVKMDSMFQFNSNFNQDISNWNVSNVTTMQIMFEGATSFNQNIGNWDLNSLTNASNMLDNSGLSKLTYDAILSGWHAQNFTNTNVNIGALNITFCDAAQLREEMMTNNIFNFIGDIEDCCSGGTDTDNDGVNDFCDLDDDNDGILDTEECPEIFTFAEVSALAAQGGYIYDEYLANGNFQDLVDYSFANPRIGTINFATQPKAGFGEALVPVSRQNGDPLDVINLDQNISITSVNTTFDFIDAGGTGTVSAWQIARGYLYIPDNISTNFSITLTAVAQCSNHLYLATTDLGTYDAAASTFNTGIINNVTANFNDLKLVNDVGTGESGNGGNGGAAGNDEVISIDQSQAGKLVAFVLLTTDNGAIGSGRITTSEPTYLFGEVPAILLQCDTDGDGIRDDKDSDSDNDGCLDVVESGGNDPGTDGIIGEVPYTYDANGLVTGTNVTGGYDGVTGNETLATQVVVNTAPTNQSENSGDTATFTIATTATSTTDFTAGVPNYTGASATDVSGATTYQWYLGDPATTGVALTNNTTYSGVTTASLGIVTELGFNNNQYCVVITHPDNGCVEETQCAVLTVLDSCDPVASGNTDTDSDGVSDVCDLDDDNDGILDTVEKYVQGFDAHWPLENSTDDISGNAHNLQAGTVTYSTDAIRGRVSASFNGTSDFLEYNDGAFLNDEITNFTYAFWVKPNNLTGVQTLLDEGGASQGIAIRLNGNTLENAVRENSLQQSTSTFNFPNDGQWHHIAITYNNGLVIMYLDGAPSNTLNIGFGALKSHLDEQNFGRSSLDDAFQATAANYYGGLMDDILHYNITLSQANIDALILGECDTDGDGITNHKDLDSDGDGCFDVVESGGTDTDGNGILDGTGIDADGLVIGGAGGYDGTTGNELVATQVVVNTAPTNQSENSGDTATFTVATTATSTTDFTVGVPDYTGASATDVSGATTYQWYLGDPATGGTALANNTTYSGVTTATLDIATELGFNNNQYCVVITHPNNSCVEEIQCAVLTVIDSCDPVASGNPDMDNDGVSDVCDLDDDNDGITDANECTNYALDISNTLGVPNTVIPLDAGNGFTIADVDGSGVDIRFVESLGSRPNYPQVKSQTGQAVIFASDEIEPAFTSFIDPSLGNTARSVMQYDILFYTTGTTIPVAVNNLSFTIGDLDYNEVLGAFSIEPSLINSLPTHITYINGVNGNYYQSNSSIIDNTLNDADLIFKYAATPITTFSFIQEKHNDVGIGLILKEINFNFCQDTDGDGITNDKDLDSDGDGCFDVVESGGTDTDGNGILDGTGIDADGLVIGGAGGYDGTTGNELVATQVVVNTAPTNQSENSGDTATFTIATTATSTRDYTAGVPNYTGASATDVSGATTYQWYLGDPATGGTALANNTTYSGVTTATLDIATELGFNNNQYCVVITHPDNGCVEETQCAVLTVLDSCDPVASGNTDTDNDGVSDVCDLDDDNDGILDSNEVSFIIDFETGNEGWQRDNRNNGIMNGSFLSSTVTMASGCAIPSFLTDTPPSGNFIYSLDTDGGAIYAESPDNLNLNLNFATDGVFKFNWINGTSDGSGLQSANSLVITLIGGGTAVSTTIDVTGLANNGWQLLEKELTVANWGVDLATVMVDVDRIEIQVESVGGAALTDSGINCSNVEFFAIDQVTFVPPGGDDTDGDGITNDKDVDSDNDGCLDVVESGGNDPDTDGIIGEAPYTYDTDGLVIGTNVTGGYDGVTGNEILATQVVVNTAPTNQSENSGDTATFTIATTATSTTDFTAGVPNYTGASATDVSGATTYQWYLGDPATGGTALANNTTYSGVTTATLDIATELGFNNNQYCVVITHPNNSCVEETQCAVLTVLDSCDPVASGNTDTDNDGVSDVCDLDDDNDGILDTDEIFCVGSPAFIDWNNADLDATAGNVTTTLSGKTITVTSVVTNPVGTTNFEGQAYNYSGSVTADAGTPLAGDVQLAIDQRNNLNATTRVTFGINPGDFENLNLFLSDFEYTDFVVYAENASGVRLSTQGWVVKSYEQNGTTPANNPNPFTINGTDISFSETNSDQNDDAMVVVFDVNTLSKATKLIVETTRASVTNSTISDAAEIMFTTNCVLGDTDGDGTPDYLDLDSDGDGCSDADEAYANTDADGGDDSVYGVGIPTVDANGLVISAGVTGSMYNTTPATTTGGQNTFQEGIQVSIITAPTDQDVCEDANVTFSAIADATILTTDLVTTASTDISYQWQVSTDNGITFTDISGESGTVASGATVSLTLSNVTTVMDDNIYKVVFTNEANICSEEAQAILTITVAPNAGTNGTLTVCAGTNPTEAALFAQLGGTPDTGGTWSNVGLVYTYSVAATSPCTVDATATITVTEQAVPNAGTNGTLTVCAGTNPTEAALFAQLGGTPDTGGTWSNVGLVYTYSVAATSPCTVDATATITVTEQAVPNAGTNGTLTVCAGTNPTEAALFAQLGGTPDTGGTWSNVGLVYTYSVAATSPCTVDATATITVTEQAVPNAGTNGTLTVCAGTNPTEAALFAQLGGTPDTGGTWSNVGLVYTYSVAATSPCTVDATATITLTEQAVPNAGTNGTLTVCAGTNPTEAALFAQLGGTPDTGGTWSNVGLVYTYSVAATSPCTVDATATITVTEQAVPNAGTNGTLTVCAGTNPTEAALFAQLGGTPDTGGTWSNVGLVYTYSVAATSPCTVDATATITVTEQAVPNAGTNGTLTVCAGTNPTEAALFAQLGGTPDTGGTWSNVGLVYTYSVAATSPCTVDATATITLTEQAVPNAGTNGTLTVCAGTNPTEAALFAQLGGTPDTGGTWSNVGLVYTYSVAATSPCTVDATATITVTEQAVPNAGTNGTLTVCAGTNPTEAALFAQLGGTPDTGGTWSNVGLVYTYSVAATSPCTVDATATITVTEQAVPNAGTNGTLTVCAGTNPTEAALFAQLGGTPDTGGTWSNVGLVYTYSVAATSPCTVDATATITLTEQAVPNAGTNGTLTVCAGTNPTEAALFAQLGGTPDTGGTWSNVGLVYTYSVAATSPCTVDATATITVTEQAVPNAGTLSGTQAVCEEGGTTSFSSDGDAGIWSSSDTSIATVNTSGVVSAVSAGTATITYTVVATFPCTLEATATRSVTVNALPSTPTVQTINQPSCTVLTGSVVLTGLPATGTWIINPGSITGVGSTTTISGLGIGTYNYTVTSTEGCISVASLDIIISNDNYLAADCDGDGVINGQEITDGTDPTDPCSFDASNITLTQGGDWNNADCDNDGLTNDEEAILGTDANNPDSDGDGVNDGQELTDGTDPTNPCDFYAASITLPVTSEGCKLAMEVTKKANVEGTSIGDRITYIIEVENTGNITLTDVSLVDIFTDANGNTISLTEEPIFITSSLDSPENRLLSGEIATYEASFIITQEALNSGGVSNSVKASASNGGLETVTDVSDDGDDSDGNTSDDPTVTELEESLVMFNLFSPNGDGVNDTFVIVDIESYPNNTLEVYNRWGNMVYKQRGYKNDWEGLSTSRSTLTESAKLPIGTYYYYIDLGNGSKPKKGWLYINR